MLIQITNRCHMVCHHCMQNSTPSGEHMTWETFEQVVEFCRQARPLVVSITGGEPTEHPQWFSMAREMLQLPSVRLMANPTNKRAIEYYCERWARIHQIFDDGRGCIKVPDALWKECNEYNRKMTGKED